MIRTRKSDTKILISVSKKERRILRRKARERNMSVSAFLRLPASEETP